MIGNFGLTRKIAKWNLGFSLIPRVIVAVILQVLPVYGLAVLFDTILNNTLEFWTKSSIISASLPQIYEKDGYEIAVKHELKPLKYTKISVTDLNTQKTEEIEIIEKSQNKVEIKNNNRHIATIKHDSNMAVVSHYHNDGKIRKKDIYDLQDQKTISKLTQILPSDFKIFAHSGKL